MLRKCYFHRDLENCLDLAIRKGKADGESMPTENTGTIFRRGYKNKICSPLPSHLHIRQGVLIFFIYLLYMSGFRTTIYGNRTHVYRFRTRVHRFRSNDSLVTPLYRLPPLKKCANFGQSSFLDRYRGVLCW